MNLVPAITLKLLVILFLGISKTIANDVQLPSKFVENAQSSHSNNWVVLVKLYLLSASKVFKLILYFRWTLQDSGSIIVM